MSEARRDHELFHYVDVREQVNVPAQLALVRRGVYKNDDGRSLRDHMELVHTDNHKDFRKERWISVAELNSHFQAVCDKVARDGTRAAPDHIVAANLTSSEKVAIYAYTLEKPPYYEILNSALHKCENAKHNPKLNAWQGFLFHFDTGLSKIRESQHKCGHRPPQLYRVAWIPNTAVEKYFSPSKIGQQVLFKAPSSTSTRILSQEFYKEQKNKDVNKGKTCIVLVLDEVASSEAVDIHQLSSFVHEDEWLLPAYFRATLGQMADAPDIGEGVRKIQLHGLRQLPQLRSICDWQGSAGVPSVLSISRLLGLAVMLSAKPPGSPGDSNQTPGGRVEDHCESLLASLVSIEHFMMTSTEPQDFDWLRMFFATLTGAGVGVGVEVGVVGVAALSALGAALGAFIAAGGFVAFHFMRADAKHPMPTLDAAAKHWDKELESVMKDAQAEMHREGDHGFVVQFFRGLVEERILRNWASRLQEGQLSRLLRISDEMVPSSQVIQEIMKEMKNYQDSVSISSGMSHAAMRISAGGPQALLNPTRHDVEQLQRMICKACGNIEEVIQEKLADAIAPEVAECSNLGLEQTIATRCMKRGLIARCHVLSETEYPHEVAYDDWAKTQADEAISLLKKGEHLCSPAPEVVSGILQRALARSTQIMSCVVHEAVQSADETITQTADREKRWMKTFAKMLFETQLIEKMVEALKPFSESEHSMSAWPWAPKAACLQSYIPSSNSQSILHPVLASLAVGNEVFESPTSTGGAPALKVLAHLDFLRLRLSRTRVVLPIGKPDAGKTTTMKYAFDLPDLRAGVTERDRTQFLSFRKSQCGNLQTDSSELLVGDAPGYGEGATHLQCRNDAVRVAAQFACDDSLREMMLVLVVLKSGRDVKESVDKLITELLQSGTAVMIIFTFADTCFLERVDSKDSEDDDWMKECAQLVKEENSKRVERLTGEGQNKPLVMYTCFSGPLSKVPQERRSRVQVEEVVKKAFHTHFSDVLKSPQELQEVVLQHFGVPRRQEQAPTSGSSSSSQGPSQ